MGIAVELGMGVYGYGLRPRVLDHVCGLHPRFRVRNHVGGIRVIALYGLGVQSEPVGIAYVNPGEVACAVIGRSR